MNIVFDENRQARMAWGKVSNVKEFNSGKHTTKFSLYVGDKTYLNVVCWDTVADTCAKLTNSDVVLIMIDREQTRNFVGNDGVEKTITEVIAGFAMPQSASTNGTKNNRNYGNPYNRPTQPQQNYNANNNNNNYGTYNNPNEYQAPQPQPYIDTDADLPF